jgi:hypothetical protein
MTPALIFSVPLVHLASALDGDLSKPVAFGTDVMEMFTDADDTQLVDQGTPVLIYASQPHTDPKNAGLFSAGALVVGGEFLRWRRANAQGRHPNPELRPVTTDTDGPVSGFIEVEGLRRLEPPVNIASGCRRANGTKFSADYVPRRPVLALASAI